MSVSITLPEVTVTASPVIASPSVTPALAASPQCGIDIYPFEQDSPISIVEGQILACTVSSSLRGGEAGVAEISLAPGGPNGQEFPSWSQVITLQSLVIVAMSRGSHSNVVFVGNVAAVQEIEAWEGGRRVVRGTTVIAYDWKAWFMAFSWSALSYLGVTNGLLIGAAAGVNGQPDQGLAMSTLSTAQQNGNPAEVAFGWFSKIMAGSQGILSDTVMQYQGSSLQWPTATTAWFEVYPGFPVFPAAFFFVSMAGTWLEKFREILQEPWYEILIGTSPPGLWFPSPPGSDVPRSAGSASVSGNSSNQAFFSNGLQFYSKSLPAASPAIAGIVGRLQPLPDLTVTSPTPTSTDGPADQPAFTFSNSASMDAWNQLKLFQSDFGESSFIKSSVTLSLQEYFNFFIVNPTYIKTLIGLPSQASSFYPIIFAGAANVAGIHRFGFHSYLKDMYWFADWAQVAAQSSLASGNAMQDLYTKITTRVASYYTPLPIMRMGSMTVPLRPDIFVGCRWQTSPFRGGNPWQFYIKGVRHSWQFGGPSTTVLDLDRGLPASVYGDAGLVSQVLQGAVDFVGGSETPTPISSSQGKPLQLFTTAPGNLKTVLGEIAGIYGTAQAQ